MYEKIWIKECRMRKFVGFLLTHTHPLKHTKPQFITNRNTHFRNDGFYFCFFCIKQKRDYKSCIPICRKLKM